MTLRALFMGGKLTILGKIPGHQRMMMVKCACGVVKMVRTWDVLNEKIISCGCERKRRHSQKMKGVFNGGN